MTDLEIVEAILTREGWNGPDFLDAGDKGGRTSWGISELGHPEEWTKGPPSKERARAIYLGRYVTPWEWVPDDRLRALLVDWSVNAGEDDALRGLQRAVIADVDGILGPQTRSLTVAALNAGRPVVADVVRQRVEFHMRRALDEPRLKVLMGMGRPLQLRFLRGWIRRSLEFVAVLLLMASPVIAQDKPNPPSWLTTAMLGAGGTLAMAEIVGTEACVQGGSCYEGNMLLPGGATKGASLGRALIKGAGTTAGIVVLMKLKRHHPRWALIGSIGLVAWNGYLTKRSFDRYPVAR